MVFSRDLQDLTANLEKRRELARIGGLLDRGAQHLSGNQELPGERIGLLLGQTPIAMLGTQEVVSKLMRDREPLSNDRIIGVDLDHLVGQTRAQLAERATFADIKAALARDRMHDYRWTGDAVLA